MNASKNIELEKAKTEESLKKQLIQKDQALKIAEEEKLKL